MKTFYKIFKKNHEKLSQSLDGKGREKLLKEIKNKNG